MVQTQLRQLTELAPGLVELVHPKAVDSGSPSIKVFTGTNLQLCQACLESDV